MATVNLWGMPHHVKYFQMLLYLGLAIWCVHSSQWLNWKINSNFNDWNKEHQELEIKKKRRSFAGSPLIGKSFLQGILMVLKEDCKIKLMSWRKVNGLCVHVCVYMWVREWVCFPCAVSSPPFLLTESWTEDKKIQCFIVRFRFCTFTSSPSRGLFLGNDPKPWWWV